MNSTYKVVFNKARGALMVVNEVTSSVQNKGSKTVVAAAATATILAGALFSAPTLAQDYSDHYDNLTLLNHVWDSKGKMDYYASIHDFGSNVSNGRDDLKMVVNQATVDGIRNVQHFADFAKSLKHNETTVQAMLVRGDNPATWKEANISVTVDKDVLGSSFYAAGINNISGVLTLTGKQTMVNVRQNANPGNTDDEYNYLAVGYMSVDFDIGGKTVETNFNADKTFFDIENTAAGQMAMGIVSMGNNKYRSSVNVEGDLDVKVKTADKGTAVGVYNVYSNLNLGSGTTIDKPGHIQMAKNLTVNVVGGNKAFGVAADIGNVVVKGDTHISATATTADKGQKPSINVPANGSYGIYVTSNGHVTLEGNEAVVTAEKALWVTEHTPIWDTTYTTMENGQKVEKEWRPATLNAKVDLHSKTTTLNGKTYVQSGRTLDLQNTINFNGDANLEGKVVGSADVVIANKGVMTLSKDAKNFKTVTFNGGTVENSAKINAEKIVLGEGVQFKDTIPNNITAGHYVFGKDSKYLISDAQLDNDTSDTKTAFSTSDDVMEFAGGTVATIENPNVTKVAVRLKADADATEGNTVKNDGKLVISAGDYDWEEVTVNMAAAENGRFAVSGGKLKTAVFNATQGNAVISDKGTLDIVKLVSNGAFDMKTGSKVTVGTFEGQANGDFTLSGGEMAVNTLNLSNGKLTVASGSTLSTVSGQIFTKALDDNGAGDKVEGLRWDKSLIFNENSTLTLNDKAYNFDYLHSAYTALNSTEKDKKPTLVFTGKLVNKDGGELKDVTVDKLPDNTIVEKVDIKTEVAAGTTEVTVDKNVGGQTIEVGAGGKTLVVSDNKTLTLVGKTDGGELIVFDKKTEGEKKVTASGSTGGLTLGSTTTETKGSVSATIEISANATLTTQKGSFTVDAVKASNAKIEVKSGELTVKDLEVKGATTIAAADDSTTKVTKLTFGAKEGETANKITITGTVDTAEIAVDTNASATIAIGTAGTDSRRGELTIGKGSLKGLTFFLDPTWVSGQEVTDASRLVLDNADASYTLDGNVVVGHNSYVVMGTKNDKEFVDLFSNGTLKWGNGAGETLAAAYIAKPVNVTTGALTVNGTLTTLPTTAATAGSVTFAANSVLVADVSKLGNDAALITAQDFSVDATSKAVVVGLKNGQKFKLALDTDGDATDFWNTESTLVSGNKLIKLGVGTGGTISASLIDADSVYGNLMQGRALANAAMGSSNAYADALLTDATGSISAADIAARFDAAMNTAGAVATFTTAYDRASEFRTAVRSEALSAESNRLWAQAIGGKTKLKGISTGAQSLHVDTDAYGLVIGGDADVNGFTLGAAFTAGTGDSENKAVVVKDDFDFYGLSLYGKTAVGGVDLIADGSMTWVKSDLTMGGLGDVDTDTTTAVYSLGVLAQKTFDLGIDVTPFIGVDVYHVRADGYSNGHGATVKDSDATAVEIPVGVKMSKAFEANGFKLSPNFTFAVIPTLGNRDIDSKVRFADAESTYNFTFADDVKIRSNIGIKADKDNFSFGLNAGYDWGDEERSAAKLMLNAQYRF